MFCVKSSDTLNKYSASKQRLYEKLYQDLGRNLIAFLADKSIHEVMLNPDGKIWVDSPLEGLVHKGQMAATVFIIPLFINTFNVRRSLQNA